MEKPKLLSFGEVLWDRIDGQDHLGGAPFNLAAHAVRCGTDACLLTAVGRDELGDRILEEMDRLGVRRNYVQRDPDHPTGTVTVELSAGGQPSYRIHRGVAWDYIAVHPEMLASLAAERFAAVCFGTLAQREPTSRATLEKVLEALPGVPAFFDVNLRQDYFSADLIRRGLQRATILKLNDSEVRTVSELIFRRAWSLEDFCRAVQQAFAVRVVLVTLGEKGCLAGEGGHAQICPGRAVEVADAVGAGDAFSAAFLAEWLRGKPVAEAAAAGNRRGAWVASRRGAIPEEE